MKPGGLGDVRRKGARRREGSGGSNNNNNTTTTTTSLEDQDERRWADERRTSNAENEVGGELVRGDDHGKIDWKRARTRRIA